MRICIDVRQHHGVVDSVTDSRQLHAVLTRWGNSYGASAEIPLVEVAMRFPSADEQLSVILYERAADHLVELLRLDAAARLGHQAAPDDPAAALVHAGLRLRHLEQQASELNGPPHPRTAGRFAGTLRRLLAAAQELMEDRGVNASLADADSELQSLEYEALPPAVTMTPSREGPTLADQFLLTCLPGSYTMTVHVRVYRPAAGPAVVVIGELSDYHSPGLLESPSAYLDDLRERLPELAAEQPRWVHYLPIDYDRYSERRLHDFLDEYTSAGLTGWGIRTVDAVGLRETTRRRVPTVILRCRRWTCGIGYESPVRRLAEAACPRCGSTKMQPVRVLVN
ncbi:hypothetical protein AB0C12_16930 [Actinoplanes sp. NPDC048967]|uniref:hypothetical protein n=1 Tax=Actinoplanes sp. NPDC048967 TaxID=3155269 RepID=UPI0033F88377